LVAVVGVGGDGADEVVSVVDVDEFAGFDEADGGAGEAAADDDAHVAVSDDAVAPDLAQDGVGRVARLGVCGGELRLVLACGRFEAGAVVVGGGAVADCLVGRSWL
jgi:hypothetical protein